MSITPLCKSTAYLSGVKDEVRDIKKQLTYIKDDIDNLQYIKSTLLLIQFNKSEDRKFIENSIKLNEENQKQMEINILSEIENIKKNLLHEKNLQLMKNTILSSQFESNLKSCEKLYNNFEEKIISQQDIIKNFIDEHSQKIINISDYMKNVHTTLDNNVIMLIKLINEKYSEIENYQQNQEELHKKYITNLESQFYQNTENLKQQIFQQLTKNETYGKSLFELISNLKTSTNDSLKKIENESINNLHILINNKHIDIRAELKIQYESFQNKCHSLDKEFSKKLNELENKFSDQLITINNLEKNQQTFNKQIVNLEEKLENIFEKFNEKLENNASLLTRLFDDKYKTLKNQQESIENSFFNNNNEMEKKFIQINEELKNNSQQIVDNDINQKTIITEQISNLNKVLSKIAENHQQKEKLSLEIINKLKIEISQINEDFQKLNKSENHLHNVLSRQRTEICSLEENQKLIEKNVEEKMKNNNQQFFETQENNLIIINKRIDDKCSKISKDCQEKEKFSIEKIRNFNVKILEIIENIEKLDKNKDQLHEAFFEQFMKIKTLENNFKLFSEENFNFKKSIENEMKKSNVTLKQ